MPPVDLGNAHLASGHGSGMPTGGNRVNANTTESDDSPPSYHVEDPQRPTTPWPRISDSPSDRADRINQWPAAETPDSAFTYSSTRRRSNTNPQRVASQSRKFKRMNPFTANRLGPVAQRRESKRAGSPGSPLNAIRGIRGLFSRASRTSGEVIAQGSAQTAHSTSGSLPDTGSRQSLFQRLQGSASGWLTTTGSMLSITPAPAHSYEIGSPYNFRHEAGIAASSGSIILRDLGIPTASENAALGESAVHGESATTGANAAPGLGLVNSRIEKSSQNEGGTTIQRDACIQGDVSAHDGTGATHADTHAISMGLSTQHQFDGHTSLPTAVTHVVSPVSPGNLEAGLCVSTTTGSSSSASRFEFTPITDVDAAAALALPVPAVPSHMTEDNHRGLHHVRKACDALLLGLIHILGFLEACVRSVIECFRDSAHPAAVENPQAQARNMVERVQTWLQMVAKVPKKLKTTLFLWFQMVAKVLEKLTANLLFWLIVVTLEICFAVFLTSFAMMIWAYYFGVEAPLGTLGISVVSLLTLAPLAGAAQHLNSLRMQPMHDIESNSRAPNPPKDFQLIIIGWMVHVTLVSTLFAATFIWKATEVGQASSIGGVTIVWLCLSLALFSTLVYTLANLYRRRVASRNLQAHNNGQGPQDHDHGHGEDQGWGGVTGISLTEIQYTSSYNTRTRTRGTSTTATPLPIQDNARTSPDGPGPDHRSPMNGSQADQTPQGLRASMIGLARSDSLIRDPARNSSPSMLSSLQDSTVDSSYSTELPTGVTALSPPPAPTGASHPGNQSPPSTHSSPAALQTLPQTVYSPPGASAITVPARTYESIAHIGTGHGSPAGPGSLTRSDTHDTITSLLATYGYGNAVPPVHRNTALHSHPVLVHQNVIHPAGVSAVFCHVDDEDQEQGQEQDAYDRAAATPPATGGASDFSRGQH